MLARSDHSPFATGWLQVAWPREMPRNEELGDGPIAFDLRFGSPYSTNTAHRCAKTRRRPPRASAWWLDSTSDRGRS
jgi:hypothetical protein